MLFLGACSRSLDQNLMADGTSLLWILTKIASKSGAHLMSMSPSGGWELVKADRDAQESRKYAKPSACHRTFAP